MHTNKFASTGAATHAAISQFNNNQKPEWLRVPEAVRLFGISRSALYEMIATDAIKSMALRKRGAFRGIRLISYDSLAADVENAARAGGEV